MKSYRKRNLRGFSKIACVLFFCGCMIAGLVFTGCAQTQDGKISDPTHTLQMNPSQDGLPGEMPGTFLPDTSLTTSQKTTDRAGSRRKTPRQTPKREQNQNGSFYSTEHEILRLRMDYQIAPIDETHVALSISLFLEYHSLTVGARTNGALVINGVTHNFESGAIDESEDVPHQTLLFAYSEQMECKPDQVIQLEATWHFQGIYGKDAEKIEDLRVLGTI